MNLPGKVAIIGGGTWATAIAKLVLCNTNSINWYIRNENTIEEFIRSGRNPMYLSSVKFEIVVSVFRPTSTILSKNQTH